MFTLILFPFEIIIHILHILLLNNNKQFSVRPVNLGTCNEGRMHPTEKLRIMEKFAVPWSAKIVSWGEGTTFTKKKITNKRTPFPNCNRYFILIFEVTRAFLSAHQTINIYVYFADRIPTYSNSIQPSIRTMICNNKKKRWSEHLSMITYKFIPRIFLKIYTHTSKCSPYCMECYNRFDYAEMHIDRSWENKNAQATFHPKLA